VRLRVVAAGTRLPAWIQQGYEEYAGRIRGEFTLELVEVALGQRRGTDAARAVRQEGERMQAALGGRPYLVALQVAGRPLTTAALAEFLAARLLEGRDVAFCIGGPDGLDASIDALADLRWSISSLTLPHGLVRVIVAEALYRAVTVYRGHPYHRG